MAKNIPDFVHNDVLTEQQIKLLKRRMNDGKLKPSDLPDDFFDEGKGLTAQHQKKALDWLEDQWLTPSGKERKNNPFGAREQQALETAEEIRLFDFFNAINPTQNRMGINNYQPAWWVIGRKNDFQYYIDGGKIHIVG